MAILVISATFMVMMFIFIFVFALQVKRWALYREEKNQQRFKELTERIDETQRMFKQDIKLILDGFKNLINKEN